LVGGWAAGYSPIDLGIALPHTWWPAAALLGGVALVLVPGIWFSARNPSQWAFYPRVRTHHWSGALLRDNGLSWAFYLVGYELLFRGLLLYPLVDSFGTWPGLTVMTALYVLVHLPHASPGETLGCFPMGILLGAVGLASGTVLAAILAHIMIALTNDFGVIRANPELRVHG